MIKITFPDGSVREYNEGVTGLQIAESISSRLAQDVLACGVNGETIDLSRPINEDATSFFINGKTNRANMLSGTLVPTCWPKHCKNFIQAFSLVSVRPLKTVFTMM